MCAKGDAQPTWATEHLPLALNPVLAAIGPAAITLCLPCTQIEQPVAVAPWLQLVHLAVLSTCTTNPHVPAKTPSQDPFSPDSMTLPTSAANENCCSQKTAQPLPCCSTALCSARLPLMPGEWQAWLPAGLQSSTLGAEDQHRLCLQLHSLTQTGAVRPAMHCCPLTWHYRGWQGHLLPECKHGHWQHMGINEG